MRKFVSWKRKLSVVLAVCMLQLFGMHLFVSSAAAADANAIPDLQAKSAILMEANTGQVLYENNADTLLPPASMSKMMTEYLIMEAIKDGKIKWEDKVPVSKQAASAIGSGQLLAEGEQLSVKDMFYAISIYSSNDASVAMAEYLGGTEEEFANMMNKKAKELGLSEGAHFINATGLTRADLGQYAPKNIEGETMMTARDAAILARHIVLDHPQVLEFTKTTSKKLRETDKTPMINFNWMLEGNKGNINFKPYAYNGLDGLKTGHTNEAGYCFTGTAQRGDMRLISVVMGTNSEPKRFQETRKVLDYGFNNFEMRKVLDANAPVEEQKTVKISKGVKKEIEAGVKEPVSFVVKKGSGDVKVTGKVDPVSDKDLVAPIKKGDKVGTATLTLDGHNQTVDLVATEDVEKGSWLRLMFRAIGEFFAGLFNSIKNLF